MTGDRKFSREDTNMKDVRALEKRVTYRTAGCEGSEAWTGRKIRCTERKRERERMKCESRNAKKRVVHRLIFKAKDLWLTDKTAWPLCMCRKGKRSKSAGWNYFWNLFSRMKICANNTEIQGKEINKFRKTTPRASGLATSNGAVHIIFGVEYWNFYLDTSQLEVLQDLISRVESEHRNW